MDKQEQVTHDENEDILENRETRKRRLEAFDKKIEIHTVHRGTSKKQNERLEIRCER